MGSTERKVLLILSDSAIKKAIESGELEIAPLLYPEQIGCNSVDLHLSNWVRTFGESPSLVLDPFDPESYPATSVIDISQEEFCLLPNQFVLASTIERVHLGDTLAGRLEGKSSLGRLGIEVHSTAGFIDSGFGGYPTLEMKNNLEVSIMLTFKMPICQMAFFRVEGTVEESYNDKGGKYSNQGEQPQPSKYFMNPLPSNKPLIKE